MLARLSRPSLALAHRRRFPLLSLICIALVALSLVGFLFFPPVPADLSMQGADLRLATWLSVTWSMAPQDREQIRALAERLQALQVDDVYIYVSYLKPDDTFNPSFDVARQFVADLKQYAPDLRALAWIGVPISTKGDQRPNRLAAAEIRRKIADFSRDAVADLGFDGLHLNAELVADGDIWLLETLAAIRAALPERAFLSATAHPLRLERPVTIMPYSAVAHHWSAAYFQRVAKSVDQIVLMAYDSGLVFPRDYLHWMRYQLERSQAALVDTSTELMVGASLSAEWTLSHQTQAETLRLALAGMKMAMAERLDGIAIYPFWETKEKDSKLIAGSLGR